MPNWKFVLPRMRNHGLSESISPPHTVAGCARDLQVILLVSLFIVSHARGQVLSEELATKPDMIVGHSFGGKVALEYVRMLHEQAHDHDLPALSPLALESLPHTVWLLDTIPGVMDGNIGAGGLQGDCFERVLLGLKYQQDQQQGGAKAQQHSQVRQGRAEVEAVLDKEDAPQALRMWIMSLLTKTKSKEKQKQQEREQQDGAGAAEGQQEQEQEQEELTFDPHTVHELLLDYASTDCLPILHRLASQDPSCQRYDSSSDSSSGSNIAGQADVQVTPPDVTCAVHVVAAEHSDRWRDGKLQELEEMAENSLTLPDGRRTLQVHTLPHSGHTLFTDNPKAVAQCILRDLQQQGGAAV